MGRSLFACGEQEEHTEHDGSGKRDDGVQIFAEKTDHNGSGDAKERQEAKNKLNGFHNKSP